MPNLKLVLSYFVGLILIGVPITTNSRTVMMGVMNKKCPEGYVLVPPDPNYPDIDSKLKYFCVAKYEMKYSTGGVPVSKPEGQPWTGDLSFLNLDGQDHRVTRIKAVASCIGLGPRYGLISNDQWQTIARNIAHVTTNWSFSNVGTLLSVGVTNIDDYSDLKAVDPINSDLCQGAGSTCDWSSWSLHRRVHRLSNGEEIWDMGGNAREWVSTDRNTPYNNAEDHYVSVAYLTSPWFGLESGFTCTSSSTVPYCQLGKAIHNQDSSGTKPAILRGSGFNSTLYDYGIFSANTNHNPNTEYNFNWGFRCVYRIEN